jgi:predicted metal-dependent hydrolase
LHAEFLQGVEQFNRGEFFEAHETWEQLWLKASGPEKNFLQGTIQLAAAFHHWARGNAQGALSLLRAGHEKLKGFPSEHRGIRVDRLREQVVTWTESLAAEQRQAPGALPQIELAQGPPGTRSF